MSASDNAVELGELLRQRGWFITAAESCTGGGIAAALTDVTGSSGWFGQSWVTYSNRAKEQLLGVEGALLKRCGAVSEEVVRAMADGAMRRAEARLALAVSGVAGPGGGSPHCPVGTVWFAWLLRPDDGAVQAQTRCQHFDGNRLEVRAASVECALCVARDMLRSYPD